MESDNLVSSVNPANLKSFAGTMKEILRFHDIKQDSCIPAQVVSYDRTNHLAKVQVLVQNVYSSSNGVKYESGDLMEIPVLRFQHGMFFMDAPLYPGDTGYVVAGHRDGSLAVEANGNAVLEPDGETARTNNHGPQPPNTYLLHRYENGFFIPCRWGSVAVEEKDKDSLVIARFKENEEKAKGGIYETDGVVSKLTLEKDGTARLVNSTGLVIEADQEHDYSYYSQWLERNIEGKAKPKVTIDPTNDLASTDAKFRQIEIPYGVDTDSDGKTHLKTKIVRILADESNERGNDIILPNSGGGGGGSGIKDVVINTFSYLDDIPFNKIRSSYDGTIKYDLVIGEKTNPDDPGGSNYCNEISDDNPTDFPDDNWISGDDSSFGETGGGGGDGGSGGGGGNGISHTPCT